MKFLIYSNSPDSPTGYGVQCAQLARNLTREGHDVAVACTFGHQIGVKKWATPHGEVTLYPSGYEQNSLDILRGHAEHFFQGDPTAGWIIPLTDMWVLGNIPLDEYQILAWTPVDHFPCPEAVIKFFHRNPGAIPVAMSRFGEKMLIEAGLIPEYAPLTVDIAAYKPTAEVAVAGELVAVRDLYHIPRDAFAVLMVAMNKDPRDRKGFNEAFRAFGAFWKNHQEAVLVVHTDRYGLLGSGINLIELARHAAVPPHALIFTEAYAHRIGLSREMLAGLYSACDVYLAPSRGEGFCVPMIEAQACGLPVIASDFSAQSELIGAGWSVTGQLDWDATQSSSYLCASVIDVYYKLEESFRADRVALAPHAIEFAAQYDIEQVFDTYWKPILDKLEPPTVVADKPMMEHVDVIVPYVRAANKKRLVESFIATNDGTATLMIGQSEGEGLLRTYAENVNAEYKHTHADFIAVVGDDVEFTEGWIDEARKLSDRYDVIGTNDSEDGRVRNPDVAAGRHADHFLIRRSYIEDEGASLSGPGVVINEAYKHFYSDKELVELAKARGVFGFAAECRIIHHHPGFDGREDLREADPTYMRAVEHSEADRITFMKHNPIIQGMRVGR